MSEASEAGEASGVSETIEARRWRCRSDAWCKGGVSVRIVRLGEGTRAAIKATSDGRVVQIRQAIK